MLGQKEKRFKTHVALSLEQLVPPSNFYRQLEAKLDLSFIYDLVKSTYATTLGRPSIDPVVFFKLQLIMFFEGIRSERQLMEMVNLHLAYRWYIGYDLDEPVPDHSSLSKIRARYGLTVFQRFFEQIVEWCIEVGLVWGKELYFDGTKIRANAAIDGMKPRWYWHAKQHIHALFIPESPLPEQPPARNAAAEPAPITTLTILPARVDSPDTEPAAQPQPTATIASASNPLWLIEKYDGTRLNDQRTSWYQRTTDSKVSPTDSDAAPMSRFTGDRAKLGYHTHYVVDGGKARIILAALVTPASVMDNTPMLDLARWVRFRWHLKPTIAVGDSKYGTIPNMVGLEQDGLKAYLPTADLSERTAFYPSERFQFDAERDLYRCPQGQTLPLRSRRKREQVLVYRADATICNQCAVKAQCTDSQSGRHICRSFFQKYLDRVKAYRETDAYQKALRKRQVWVEPLFGEAKQWHWMTRFRLRGLLKVNIEGLIVAAGQNLKRLLKQSGWGQPKPPAAGVLLQFPQHYFFLFLAKWVNAFTHARSTFSTRWNLILHIMARASWEPAQVTGEYRGDTLELEGFIHCSTRQQVVWVANRLYRSQTGLVLLCIDADKIQPEIRHESADGERFPHIYGPLNADAVIKVVDFPPGADGTFELPHLPPP